MSDVDDRHLRALEASIRDLTSVIREFQKSVEQTYVRKDVIEPQMQEMRNDIQSHDQWLTWALRIVVGAVIAALLGVVIMSGGAPPV